MMRIDIRFAGLDEQAEQQLRLACKLFDSQQLRASVNPWDGTRCDVLVANGQDGYGQHTMDIARRRGMPILALGGEEAEEGGVRSLPGDCSAPQIHHRLAALLRVQEASLERTPASNMFGICQLASDDSLRGKDLTATIGSLTIELLPSMGRVIAQSKSDLLASGVALCNPGWSFKPWQGTSSAQVSLSLDSFFITAALHGCAQLPSYPAGRYGLEDWPDLGGASELVNALKVAQHLVKRRHNQEELASICQMASSEVSACLWAYRATGLLTGADGADDGPSIAVLSPDSSPKPMLGLLGKIASRFGLQ